MRHRGWAEELDHELARRGVPARSRRRLLAEWRDHADDLKDEEGLTMTDDVLNERLGRPTDLAAHAAEQSRRATWVARHPAAVFALLPVPAAILALIATLVLYAIVAQGVAEVSAGGFEDLPRPTTVALAYGLTWAIRFAPFVMLAALFARLAVRSRVSRRWLGVAAAQVLLLAGSMVASITVSDVPWQSSISLAFLWFPYPDDDGWRLPFLAAVGWTQVGQVLVPVAVAALIVRAARRRDATPAACAM